METNATAWENVFGQLRGITCNIEKIQNSLCMGGTIVDLKRWVKQLDVEDHRSTGVNFLIDDILKTYSLHFDKSRQLGTEDQLCNMMKSDGLKLKSAREILQGLQAKKSALHRDVQEAILKLRIELTETAIQEIYDKKLKSIYKRNDKNLDELYELVKARNHSRQVRKFIEIDEKAIADLVAVQIVTFEKVRNIFSSVESNKEIYKTYREAKKIIYEAADIAVNIHQSSLSKIKKLFPRKKPKMFHVFKEKKIKFVTESNSKFDVIKMRLRKKVHVKFEVQLKLRRNYRWTFRKKKI